MDPYVHGLETLKTTSHVHVDSVTQSHLQHVQHLFLLVNKFGRLLPSTWSSHVDPYIEVGKCVCGSWEWNNSAMFACHRLTAEQLCSLEPPLKEF